MKRFFIRLLPIPLVFLGMNAVTAHATSAKELAPGIQCPLPGNDKAGLSRRPGGTTVPSARSIPVTNYVGPNENITAVANAIGLRAKGFVTEVAFKSGVILSKPVTITVEYASPAGQYRSPAQSYDTCQGNKFLYNEPISASAKNRGDAAQTKPRQMSIKVTLTEDRPDGQPHVFTIPLTATLDPNLDIHYDSRSTINTSTRLD